MEQRPILILLGILAAGAVLAEEAYTWTDEDGIVHYSDRPQPGAKRIYLPEPNASSSLAKSRGQTSAEDDESAAPAAPFRYESLAVASPAAEATLWNIEGVLSVSLSLSPALQQGHQVRVYFDGKPQMVAGTSLELQEVWRGEHNLQAEVLDATGKLMIRSKPIRFYVQQSTVF